MVEIYVKFEELRKICNNMQISSSRELLTHFLAESTSLRCKTIFMSKCLIFHYKFTPSRIRISDSLIIVLWYATQYCWRLETHESSGLGERLTGKSRKWWDGMGQEGELWHLKVVEVDNAVIGGKPDTHVRPSRIRRFFVIPASSKYRQMSPICKSVKCLLYVNRSNVSYM